MPARKKSTLNKRHDTKGDKQQRVDSEKALQPETVLSKPPAKLTGHKVARQTWFDVISLQNETQAAQDGNPIITAYDEKSLIDYCLLVEEEVGLEGELKTIRSERKKLAADVKKMKPTDENVKVWLGRWNVITSLAAMIIKIDARLDGKRKLKVTLARDLYLTPRSRAGVAPPTKEPDKPKSEMEGLL